MLQDPFVVTCVYRHKPSRSNTTQRALPFFLMKISTRMEFWQPPLLSSSISLSIFLNLGSCDWSLASHSLSALGRGRAALQTNRSTRIELIVRAVWVLNIRYLRNYGSRSLQMASLSLLSVLFKRVPNVATITTLVGKGALWWSRDFITSKTCWWSRTEDNLIELALLSINENYFDDKLWVYTRLL